MSIFNKRNALFGWMAWAVTKRAMEQKARRNARRAVPHKAADHKGISAGAAAAIAAAVGGLLFWRRRRADETGASGADE